MGDARRTVHTRPGGPALLLAALLLPLLTACDSILSGDRTPPGEARLTVRGDATTTLRLVTSGSFQQTGGDEGGVTLFLSDTVLVDPPFDGTFAMDPQAARFFARLTNEGEGEPAITMQIFFDEDLAYDNSATMGPGSFMEYSKIFRAN